MHGSNCGEDDDDDGDDDGTDDGTDVRTEDDHGDDVTGRTIYCDQSLKSSATFGQIFPSVSTTGSRRIDNIRYKNLSVGPGFSL